MYDPVVIDISIIPNLYVKAYTQSHSFVDLLTRILATFFPKRKIFLAFSLCCVMIVTRFLPVTMRKELNDYECKETNETVF